MLRICRKLCASSGVASIPSDHARRVVGVAIVLAPLSGRCTTSATWCGSGLVIFSLRTRNIFAVSARATSTWTCRTWLCPRATTPTVSSRWRCVWWWKTACPTAQPVGISGGTTASLCHTPRFRIGWRLGGKKAEQRIRSDYLDAALDDFSGYIAADELYDGPFCVLSIVDNHTFRRLIYEVLDHDPDHADIERFFRTFQAAIQRRGLVLRGITTDGSNLYPEPISKVFGDVSHQLCEFHVIKELTKAVLHAGAKVRRELAATRTQAWPRASVFACRPQGRSAGEADRTESGGPVSASVSVRAARSDSSPARDPGANHPRAARVANASRCHGRNLPPLRPSLSD